MDDAIIISTASDRELLEMALVRASTAEALVVAMLEVIHRQNPHAFDDQLLRLLDEAEQLERDAHHMDLRRRTIQRLRRLLDFPSDE